MATIPGHICIRHLGNALRKVMRSVPAEYGLSLSYRIDIDDQDESCVLIVRALDCVSVEAPLNLAGLEHFSEPISHAMFTALLPVIEKAQELRAAADATSNLSVVK